MSNPKKPVKKAAATKKKTVVKKPALKKPAAAKKPAPAKKAAPKKIAAKKPVAKKPLIKRVVVKKIVKKIIVKRPIGKTGGAVVRPSARGSNPWNVPDDVANLFVAFSEDNGKLGGKFIQAVQALSNRSEREIMQCLDWDSVAGEKSISYLRERLRLSDADISNVKSGRPIGQFRFEEFLSGSVFKRNPLTDEEIEKIVDELMERLMECCICCRCWPCRPWPFCRICFRHRCLVEVGTVGSATFPHAHRMQFTGATVTTSGTVATITINGGSGGVTMSDVNNAITTHDGAANTHPNHTHDILDNADVVSKAKSIKFAGSTVSLNAGTGQALVSGYALANHDHDCAEITDLNLGNYATTTALNVHNHYSRICFKHEFDIVNIIIEGSGWIKYDLAPAVKDFLFPGDPTKTVNDIPVSFQYLLTTYSTNKIYSYAIANDGSEVRNMYVEEDNDLYTETVNEGAPPVPTLKIWKRAKMIRQDGKIYDAGTSWDLFTLVIVFECMEK